MIDFFIMGELKLCYIWKSGSKSNMNDSIITQRILQFVILKSRETWAVLHKILINLVVISFIWMDLSCSEV